MLFLQPIARMGLCMAVSVWCRETVEDAVYIARRLVENSFNSLGIMATVYPPDHPMLPGQPFALQEYYASCHRNGSLTLLFLPISLHTYCIRLTVGSVTIFKDISTVPEKKMIKVCYLAKHPDAKWWLPEDDDAAHVSYWARFDPESVYFVGGFGDEHYIGYIPLHLYRNAYLSWPSMILPGDVAEEGFVGQH